MRISSRKTSREWLLAIEEGDTVSDLELTLRTHIPPAAKLLSDAALICGPARVVVGSGTTSKEIADMMAAFTPGTPLKKEAHDWLIMWESRVNAALASDGELDWESMYYGLRDMFVDADGGITIPECGYCQQPARWLVANEFRCSDHGPRRQGGQS